MSKQTGTISERASATSGPPKPTSEEMSLSSPFAVTHSTMPAPLPGDIPQSTVPLEFFSEVITDAKTLTEHRDAWDNLHARSIEPNIFYGSDLVLSAYRHLQPAGTPRFLVVKARMRGAPQREPEWVGFFPFVVHRRFRGLPVRHLKLLHHDYCFLRTPLIRKDVGLDVVNALLDWIDSLRDVMVVEMADQNADGPYHRWLIEAFTRRGSRPWASAPLARAFLVKEASADAYIRRAISGGKLKELRRLERRLAEAGEVRFDSLTAEGNIDQAIEQFLDLEKQSWKGDSGTAMACGERDRTFFEEIARSLFAKGRLRMHFLRQGDKPIAAKCNLLAPPGAYAFKIAFSPEYARYSPGVQLEVDNIRRLHAEADVEWMDSCADPNHSMIDHLWRDRKIMQTWIIPTSRRGANVFTGLLPVLASMRRLISKAP